MMFRCSRSLLLLSVVALLLALLVPAVAGAAPSEPDSTGWLAPWAVPDPPVVSVERAATSNARLYWPHVGQDAAYYEIYRSTGPYPEPGVAPANRVQDLPAGAYGIGSTVEHIDDGVDRYDADGTTATVVVIGDAQTNYFWVVQSRSTGGETSGASNLVGEFDFALVKGS